jgi:hypothetical protein
MMRCLANLIAVWVAGVCSACLAANSSGTPYVGALITTATSTDHPDARAAAMDAIGALGAKGLGGDVNAAVAALAGIVESPKGQPPEADDFLRFHAVLALEKIGPGARNALPALAGAGTPPTVAAKKPSSAASFSCLRALLRSLWKPVACGSVPAGPIQLGPDRTFKAEIVAAVSVIAADDKSKTASTPAPTSPNPATVVGLRLDLTNKDPNTKINALNRLAGFKAEALPVLAEVADLMKDSESGVRMAAATATKQILDQLPKDPPSTAAEWTYVYETNLASMLQACPQHPAPERQAAALALVAIAAKEPVAYGILDGIAKKGDSDPSITAIAKQAVAPPTPQPGQTPPQPTPGAATPQPVKTDASAKDNPCGSAQATN